MKFDLSLIPTTFDSVHAALAATAAGLFFLQVLFLILAIMAFRKKCKPSMERDDERPGPSAVAIATGNQAAAAPQVADNIEVHSQDAALQLLSLLQNEARFLDFVHESVTSYSDTEIGAAARVVHDGCAKVLRQYFEVGAVRTENEGQRITVPAGFDASSIRLTGNVVGSAPFTGTLVHRGWKVTEVRLPKINEGHNSKVLAPAEVEL
jgi:hypothetical protein